MHTPPSDFRRTRRSTAGRRSFHLFALVAAMAGVGCEEPCTLRDNGDGTQTLACNGSEAVIGSGCTSTDHGDGTQTIACADGTEVTISDGSDGVSCGLTDPGDGTVTFSCSDGSEWTFAPGCETRRLDFRTHEVVLADCPDGSTLTLSRELKQAPVHSLAAGGYHTCGLRTDGSAHCWGANQHGQSAEQEGVFVQIAAGSYHTCGLRPDGSAHCWGWGDDGQTDAQNGERFVQLVAGATHTCGLRPDGSAHCWGSVGLGYVVEAPSGSFVQLAARSSHTCGLRADGSAICWGRDDLGQSADQPDEDFVQIAAGQNTSCGVREDGSWRCWGNYLQSADQPGETFAEISAGFLHTCGLRFDGTSHCWGNPGAGQTAAQPGEEFVQIAAGGVHTCGLRADGSAHCWGKSDEGQTTPPWQFARRAAESPVGLVTGLAYESWNFVTTGLPNFGSLGAPNATGTVTNVGLPSPGDGFALRITGYVQVPADGEYTFGLTSDEGSRLLLGSDVVIDHDGLHTASTKSEYVALEAGWHPITIEYFENSGDETLSLTMASGDGPAAPIPDSDLAHVP